MPSQLLGNPQAISDVAQCITQCFKLCKTYGKTEHDMESIVDGFIAMLGDYPIDKIKKAFVTHVQRDEQLPTLAGIISLIKRNGRPPMNESDVIAARKKHGEDRTPDDWQIIREWDAQQADSWGDDVAAQQENYRAENVRLRQEVKVLREKIATMQAAAVLQQRIELITPVTAKLFVGKSAHDVHQEKIDSTVAYMRKTNCTDADVAEFLQYEKNIANNSSHG